MTDEIIGRDPFSHGARDAPGLGQRREAAEWRLVSAASHELRTPLTALRTEVELALLGNRDASELRAALRSAADEILSGLGLALVAAIATAHGGVATVCNLPEGGADACIALPRA